MKQVAVGALVVTALLPIGSCQEADPVIRPWRGRRRRSRLGLRRGANLVSPRSRHRLLSLRVVHYARAGPGRGAFVTPGNLQRFGFLPNPTNQTYNPDGLPIGFSRTALRLDKGPFQCWQGKWVGLTCAACHTGRLNYHGASLLIEAARRRATSKRSASGSPRRSAPIGADPQKAQRFVGRGPGAPAGPEPGGRAGEPAMLRQASEARARIEREGPSQRR